MPGPDKKEIEAKLRANIAMLNKLVGFTCTEKDIERMLSDDRFNTYNKAQNYKRPYEEAAEKARSYAPANILPMEFARVSPCIVDMSGTPEGEKFNRELFHDLNRDDEKGLMARHRYVCTYLNRIKHVDIDKLMDLSSTEKYLDDAIENSSLYNLGMASNQATEGYFGQLRFQYAEPKYLQDMNGFSQHFGFKGQFAKYAAKEEFLTWPWDMLTNKQVEKLIPMTATHPELIEPLIKNEYSSFIPSKNNMLVELQEAKDTGFLDGDDFIPEYIQPRHPDEKLFGGGYLSRMEHADRMIEEIRKYDISGLSESVQNDYKTRLMPLVDKIEKEIKGFPLYPDQKESAEIVKTFGKVPDEINEFARKIALSKASTPQDKEYLKTVTNLRDSMGLYAKTSMLDSLVAYAKIDNPDWQKDKVVHDAGLELVTDGDKAEIESEMNADPVEGSSFVQRMNNLATRAQFAKDLKAICTQLKATDEWFVWTNTQTFNDMLKAANKLSGMLEKFEAKGIEPNHAKMLETYNELTDLAWNYVDNKTAKIKANHEKAKDPSMRAIHRLQAATSLANILEGGEALQSGKSANAEDLGIMIKDINERCTRMANGERIFHDDKGLQGAEVFLKEATRYLETHPNALAKSGLGDNDFAAARENMRSMSRELEGELPEEIAPQQALL